MERLNNISKDHIKWGLSLILIVSFAWAHAAGSRSLEADIAQASSANEKRVALVIGNSNYQAAPLANPVNDAKAMADKLRGLGFDVVEMENITQKQIGTVLRTFRSKLTPGAVALFFYAGHGLQIKGENYLPAVDAEINAEEDVPNQSLAMRQVMDVLDTAKTRLNLVFLDACRNNPYSRSFRDASGGLAKITAPSGTLISFATRPGNTASDGTRKNGLYTENLLARMDEPGIPVEVVLKRVNSDVKNASKGKQEPWTEGSIEGDFYFRIEIVVPQPVVVEKPVKQDSDALEISYWESIKSSTDKTDFMLYLEQFPNGKFAGLAKNRMKNLDAAEATKVKAEQDALAKADAASKKAAKAKTQTEAQQRVTQENLAAEKARSASTKPVQVATAVPSTQVIENGQSPSQGDKKYWNYAYSSNSRGKHGEISFEVQNESAKSVEELIKIKIEGEQKYELEHKAVKDISLSSFQTPRLHPYFEFSPYLTTYDDLQVGKKWGTSDINTYLPNGSEMGSSDWTFNVKVLGKESVTVPAGTFDAIKVKFYGIRPSAAGHCGSCNVADVEETIWYAPGVGRYVKLKRDVYKQFHTYNYDESFELKEFYANGKGTPQNNVVAALPATTIALSPKLPRPGDFWKYDWVNHTGSKSAIFAHEVTNVSNEGISETTTTNETTKTNGKEMERSFQGKMQVVESMFDGRHLIEPLPYLVDFESLDTGKNWPDIELVSTTPGAEGWKVRGHVEGTEIVSTPAGKFNATKVVIQGVRPWLPGYGVTTPTSFTQEIWYVPEVKRCVKRIVKEKGGDGSFVADVTFHEFTLREFHLNN